MADFDLRTFASSLARLRGNIKALIEEIEVLLLKSVGFFDFDVVGLTDCGLGLLGGYFKISLFFAKVLESRKSSFSLARSAYRSRLLGRKLC